MSEEKSLVAKRNIKYLYNLLKDNYSQDMTIDVFIEMLKSDKRLEKTFFNNKCSLDNKKESTIHPCLMNDTDEEAYIPKY